VSLASKPEAEMENGVLVVGELNVDLILSGLAAFPVLGKEILAGGAHQVMGSSSAICAAGMARLGLQVDYLGKVGTDTYGDFVTDQLRALGIGTHHVIHDRSAQTGVTVSLTYPDDRALVTYLGCSSELRLEDVDKSILPGYSHLHVGSYFLQRGLQSGLGELFQRAHHAGLTVSLDMGFDPYEEWGDDSLMAVLPLVDVFLPNEVEARGIARVDDTEAALRVLAPRTRLIVVKCGASGAMTLRDGQIIHSPAFQVDVRDTTGAGDSFNAGFIHAHVFQCLPPEGAMRFANACGALSTTGFGGTGAQPRLEQVHAFLEARASQI
jgi:sugar/nucleoside kinase (ribokinase family)